MKQHRQLQPGRRPPDRHHPLVVDVHRSPAFRAQGVTEQSGALVVGLADAGDAHGLDIRFEFGDRFGGEAFLETAGEVDGSEGEKTIRMFLFIGMKSVLGGKPAVGQRRIDEDGHAHLIHDLELFLRIAVAGRQVGVNVHDGVAGFLKIGPRDGDLGIGRGFRARRDGRLRRQWFAQKIPAPGFMSQGQADGIAFCLPGTGHHRVSRLVPGLFPDFAKGVSGHDGSSGQGKNDRITLPWLALVACNHDDIPAEIVVGFDPDDPAIDEQLPTLLIVGIVSNGLFDETLGWRLGHHGIQGECQNGCQGDDEISFLHWGIGLISPCFMGIY